MHNKIPNSIESYTMPDFSQRLWAKTGTATWTWGSPELKPVPVRLEVIQVWMHVQDYMIFIMEENRMWQIQKKETFDIWTSNVCILKIAYFEDKCRIYVDYKGYKVIIPMGIWGFEEEIQERKIEIEIDGEKGNFKTLSYVVKENDLKLFCDMIFFFLSEHNLDRALNDVFKY